MAASNPQGGWSEPVRISGWFGTEKQGASIAVTDMAANRAADLFFFHIDNPHGENKGDYRILFDR